MSSDSLHSSFHPHLSRQNAPHCLFCRSSSFCSCITLICFQATATLIMSTFAKRIVITVGGNTTSNPGAVFSPQSVQARTGDVVFFNCASLPLPLVQILIFASSSHSRKSYRNSIYLCLPLHPRTLHEFDCQWI